MKSVKRGGRRITCSGVDDDGYGCESLVYVVGKGKKYEGVKGERVVNCCTWCGLVAVDMPK